MTDGFETVQLKTEHGGDVEARRSGFASVHVGGAIDGYQVIDNLAEGGMGAVFRARAPEGQGEVALKTPLPGGRGGTYRHRMRRFLREARLTARMDHDGVARVRDEGQCNGLPYFTIDLVDGEPLSERLYREGVLPIVEAVQIVELTARAAHHVHEQGVVHRDLKPANILIRPDGTPVIIDFGLARDATGIDPRITASGVWLGTPAYISPEQALGEASRVDGRADVYSLGAVLYELLTGLPPHGIGSPRTIFRALRGKDPKAPSELREAIPANVDRIVLRALSRHPDDRYPNAEAFANALATLIEQLEANPPVDDLDSSALECSWESSEMKLAGADTVCGWNETSSLLFQEASSEVELVPVPEEPASSKSKRVRRKRRRSSGTRRSSRSSSRSSTRSSRSTTRRSLRRTRSVRRSSAVETFSRYVAFGGPAVAALMGLLLLI